MSIGAIEAEIFGGEGIHHPPPWYTSLEHPMTSGVKIRNQGAILDPEHYPILVHFAAHNVYKRRLDLSGKPLADPVKHEVGESEAQANSTELEASLKYMKKGFHKLHIIYSQLKILI